MSRTSPLVHRYHRNIGTSAVVKLPLSSSVRLSRMYLMTLANESSEVDERVLRRPFATLRESDFLAIGHGQSFPEETPVRGSVGDRIIHGGDVYIARAAAGVPRRGLCTLEHRRSIIDGTKS